MATGAALRTWTGLLTLLQLGVAVAVICIVHFKLGHVQAVKTDQNSFSATGQCYLGPDTERSNLCVYAYAIGAFSILATILWSLFLCCTCDLCGCSPIFEAIFSGLGVAWWVVAGIVLMRNARDAAAQNITPGLYNWRTSVWVLCWVAVGLFGLTAILSIFRVFQQLANCCGGGKRRNSVGYA